MSEIYEQKRYFAVALDPVYIGTGGYRIGRVDNTIVREPATGIPKIPGTTIEGVCRSYAYLKAKENGEDLKPECAKGKVKDEKEPCGKCRICITFGFTGKNIASQAMALFSDARILFFPVATMIGPVWVTCPMVLRDAGIKEYSNNNSGKDVPEPTENKFIIPKFPDSEESAVNPPDGRLNFGWLLLEKDGNHETTLSKWKYTENGFTKAITDVVSDVVSKDILKRVVIVSDALFQQIVNSNLEVRTSVAIDPERGAAEEGALFTYEVIPRGTVFWFDVTFQNPKYFQIDEIGGCDKTDDKQTPIECVRQTIEKGMSLFEHLGVGGMGSRGFGRLKVNLQGGEK